MRLLWAVVFGRVRTRVGWARSDLLPKKRCEGVAAGGFRPGFGLGAVWGSVGSCRRSVVRGGNRWEDAAGALDLRNGVRLFRWSSLIAA